MAPLSLLLWSRARIIGYHLLLCFLSGLAACGIVYLLLRYKFIVFLLFEMLGHELDVQYQ